MKNLLKSLVFQIFPQPAPARSPADRWVLALDAMYGRIEGYSNNRLASVTPSASEAMLRHAWGVDGLAAERYAKVAEVLDWLAQKGHRMDPAFAAPGDEEAVHDLLAWDIARSVMVTRHAFSVPYLTRDQAWKYVRQAARLAQQSYSSWEEYGRRYLRGRARWNGERDKKIDAAVDFLLTNDKSPWRQLDWHTPLVWPESESQPTST